MSWLAKFKMSPEKNERLPLTQATTPAATSSSTNASISVPTPQPIPRESASAFLNGLTWYFQSQQPICQQPQSQQVFNSQFGYPRAHNQQLQQIFPTAHSVPFPRNLPEPMYLPSLEQSLFVRPNNLAPQASNPPQLQQPLQTRQPQQGVALNDAYFGGQQNAPGRIGANQDLASHISSAIVDNSRILSGVHSPTDSLWLPLMSGLSPFTTPLASSKKLNLSPLSPFHNIHFSANECSFPAKSKEGVSVSVASQGNKHTFQHAQMSKSSSDASTVAGPHNRTSNIAHQSVSNSF